jgi:hypothetical protein
MSDTNKIENIFNDNKINPSIEELIELDIKYFIIFFINICKFYIVEPLKQNAIKSEVDKNNLITKLDALLGYNSKYKSKLGEEMYSSMNDILESLRLNIGKITINSKSLESSTSESKTEMDSTLKQQIITTAIAGVEKYIREKGSVSEIKPTEQSGFPETIGTELPTSVTITQSSIQPGDPNIAPEDPEFAEEEVLRSVSTDLVTSQNRRRRSLSQGLDTSRETPIRANSLGTIIESGSATAKIKQPATIEELKNVWGLQKEEAQNIKRPLSQNLNILLNSRLRTSNEHPGGEGNLFNIINTPSEDLIQEIISKISNLDQTTTLNIDYNFGEKITQFFNDPNRFVNTNIDIYQIQQNRDNYNIVIDPAGAIFENNSKLGNMGGLSRSIYKYIISGDPITDQYKPHPQKFPDSTYADVSLNINFSNLIKKYLDSSDNFQFYTQEYTVPELLDPMVNNKINILHIKSINLQEISKINDIVYRLKEVYSNIFNGIIHILNNNTEFNTNFKVIKIFIPNISSGIFAPSNININNGFIIINQSDKKQFNKYFNICGLIAILISLYELNEIMLDKLNSVNITFCGFTKNVNVIEPNVEPLAVEADLQEVEQEGAAESEGVAAVEGEAADPQEVEQEGAAESEGGVAAVEGEAAEVAEPNIFPEKSMITELIKSIPQSPEPIIAPNTIYNNAATIFNKDGTSLQKVLEKIIPNKTVESVYYILLQGEYNSRFLQFNNILNESNKHIIIDPMIIDNTVDQLTYKNLKDITLLFADYILFNLYDTVGFPGSRKLKYPEIVYKNKNTEINEQKELLFNNLYKKVKGLTIENPMYESYNINEYNNTESKFVTLGLNKLNILHFLSSDFSKSELSALDFINSLAKQYIIIFNALIINNNDLIEKIHITKLSRYNYGPNKINEIKKQFQPGSTLLTNEYNQIFNKCTLIAIIYSIVNIISNDSKKVTNLIDIFKKISFYDFPLDKLILFNYIIETK